MGVVVSTSNDLKMAMAMRKLQSPILKPLEEQESAIRIACILGDHKKVCLLIQDGADVNEASKDGGTPLMMACQLQKEKIVSTLLEVKTLDVNLANGAGYTALHYACEVGNERIVDLLIKKGSKIDVQNLVKKTPLLMSISKGNVNIAMMLLNNTTKDTLDVNRTDQDGNTALRFACEIGNEKLVDTLMERGADVDIQNEMGDTSLTGAIACGHEDIAKKILEHTKQNMDTVNKEGYTALMWAIIHAQDNLAELLVEKGAKVCTANEKGMTALMFACMEGTDKSVEFLLDKGAKIIVKNSKGKMPFMYACEFGRVNVVKVLLETFPGELEINASDEDNKTALMYACCNGSSDIVRLLIDHAKIDINTKDKNGKTAMMYSSENGRSEIVEMLIGQKDIDVSLTDKDDKTALMYASQNGSALTIMYLLFKGADVDALDWDRKSALCYARMGGHKKAMHLLNGCDVTDFKSGECKPSDINFKKIIKKVPSLMSKLLTIFEFFK